MHAVLHDLRLAIKWLDSAVELWNTAHLGSHILQFRLESVNSLEKTAQVIGVLVYSGLDASEFFADSFVYFLVKEKTVHFFRVVPAELKELGERHVFLPNLLQLLETFVLRISDYNLLVLEDSFLFSLWWNHIDLDLRFDSRSFHWHYWGTIMLHERLRLLQLKSWLR